MRRICHFVYLQGEDVLKKIPKNQQHINIDLILLELVDICSRFVSVVEIPDYSAELPLVKLELSQNNFTGTNHFGDPLVSTGSNSLYLSRCISRCNAILYLHWLTTMMEGK